MFITTCERIGLVTLMICLACGISGCTTGYISATTQSLIGLDAGSNPQTQVPHIRFGFCRNQYYYIPTGKSESKGGPSTGKADETPTLLSSLDVDMAFFQSTKIREKFAVGKTAVGTESAKTLFNPQYAPVKSPPGSTTSQLREQIFTLTQDNQSMREKGKTWVNDNYKTYSTSPFESFVIRMTDDAILQKLLTHLKTP